jgi:hypothetical protein
MYLVRGAFYYRLDVCTGLCKLLFQTQFLSNYPTIIILYLYNNIPQVNNNIKLCLTTYVHVYYSFLILHLLYVCYDPDMIATLSLTYFNVMT